MRLRSAMTRPTRLAAVACAVTVAALCTGVGASASEPRTPGTVPFKTDAQNVHDLTTGVFANDLAAALMGPDATISAATFTGDPHSAGLASGFSADLGIDSGVVLSSGAVASSSDGQFASSIAGPNLAPDITAAFGTPGDPDLDQLVAPQTTFDAADLEFDFEMAATNLTFRFVFGSDEYPAYVSSEFNDAFAFYLDGTNCATVPDPLGGGGVVPVSVDTVNSETNSGLYRSNAQTDDPPTPLMTELGGLTTTLTCSVYAAAGTTHHLKLVIADTGDDQWDSTVLVETGTAAPNQPPVAEDQSVTVMDETPTPITLTGYDADGDDLVYTVDDYPDFGHLDGTAPDVTYIANPGFYGVDSFTFTVTDGMADSDPPGNVAVLVTNQSQSPPPPTETPTDSPSPPPTTDPPTDPPATTEPGSPPAETTTVGEPDSPTRSSTSHGRGGKTKSETVATSTSVAAATGKLSGTGAPNSTPWLGAAGISGALAGIVLIMTARRRLAR